jgi:hypothetical protein
MADELQIPNLAPKKLSELPEVQAIALTDKVLIVRSGKNYVLPAYFFADETRMNGNKLESKQLDGTWATLLDFSDVRFDGGEYTKP